jgi:prepilin-type N-terminal cleavage/methylation domain-containing protein
MKSERGLTLIETVIALGILGIVAAAILGSFRTAIITEMRVDHGETAKNLAESQMEYVKDLPYLDSYDAVSLPGYDRFVASIITGSVTDHENDNIQKVTVQVWLEGHEEEPPLISLTNYKVR